MTVTIEPVRNRTQLTEFIRLPRHLYHGMPGYVPPLDIERRELLDPKKSPFFSHGYAAYWIARRKGHPVGRVSAQIDQLSGPSAPSDLGLFGCLDAIDDREVIAELLHTAEEWLRRHNRRHIRGPFLLSINGETGLLIEGQSEPPVTLLPWHPAYLNQYLREAGYVCAMRLFSYVLELKKFSIERLHQLDVLRQGNNFSVRSMDLDNFETEMEIGRKLFNDGWQNNWGFTPGSVADTRGLARAFKPFLLRDGGFFISVRDEPAAFALSIPNIFEITSDIGPVPSLLGWFRLAIRNLETTVSEFPFGIYRCCLEASWHRDRQNHARRGHSTS